MQAFNFPLGLIKYIVVIRHIMRRAVFFGACLETGRHACRCLLYKIGNKGSV